MFTGLIEEVGVVSAVRHAGGHSRLAVQAPRVGPGSAMGDSICVNGVCLTVAAGSAEVLEFDAIAETLRRSNLGELRPGDGVNLERAMTAGSRLGGHIVQGHVDAVGQIVRVTPEATISASQSTGAPASRASRARRTTSGECATSAARSTCPQAWIIRTATRATSSGRPERSASARMVAKDWR